MKKRNTAAEKDFTTRPQKDFLDMIAPSVVKSRRKGRRNPPHLYPPCYSGRGKKDHCQCRK